MTVLTVVGDEPSNGTVEVRQAGKEEEDPSSDKGEDGEDCV